MKKLTGIPASDGIAIGPPFFFQPETPSVERRTVADVPAELARFEAAIARADEMLSALKAKVEETAGSEEAQIFEVHRMFLADPAFVGTIRDIVEAEQINAEAAIERTVDDLVAQFKALEDEYFQLRAADVEDVGLRLLRLLAGGGQSDLAGLAAPAIVVAPDLTPTDTASLERDKVLAFCTAAGGGTSHSAILARSLGIPAVVGLGDGLLNATSFGQLIVDGGSGEVWLDPDAETVAAYQARLQTRLETQAQARARALEPAVTTDGYRSEIVANIGSLEEAKEALELGAEGVGLLRTEFLFLQRETLPDEEEQYEVYRALADVFQQRPLIVRTLDIGGDKPLPALEMPPEPNPFLGRRAIRLSLAEPEMFQTQLRAVLRAGHERNLKIMFPMIGSLSDLSRAREQLEEARAALEARQVPYARTLEVGIMIEIPSAALLADVLAPHVDFFSIGTNDLSQYTLAADRTNPLVAPLADPLHPAVLRLMHQVVQAAHAHQKWVGICGELAGNPLAVPLLLGLGLDELSMAAPAIPTVKALIRTLSLADARRVAEECLGLPDVTQVRQFLGSIS